MAVIGLFLSALVAATLLPMQSEAVLVALLVQGVHPVAILLAVATFGNVLGSVINWVVGRFLLRFQERRWFPASPAQMDRASAWYHRYGRWSLLASWVPIVGDPLTVVAGVLKEPLLPFVILVTIAKAGRYAALAMLTLSFS